MFVFKEKKILNNNHNNNNKSKKKRHIYREKSNCQLMLVSWQVKEGKNKYQLFLKGVCFRRKKNPKY